MNSVLMQFLPCISTSGLELLRSETNNIQDIRVRTLQPDFEAMLTYGANFVRLTEKKCYLSTEFEEQAKANQFF